MATRCTHPLTVSLVIFGSKLVWNLTESFNLCLADSGSKQDTVKFVQDTSKFWYKPDISRDQGKYWSWTTVVNGHLWEDNTPLCKGFLYVQCRLSLTLAYLCFLLLLTYWTAIAVLKDKEPGSFIVRDSHSFRGAYGLAMKVATPPPSVIQSKKGGLNAMFCIHKLSVSCQESTAKMIFKGANLSTVSQLNGSVLPSILDFYHYFNLQFMLITY